MDHRALDELIRDLDRLIPDKPGILTGHRERFDWKALHGRAREIQAGFSAGIRYPTGEERQRAWERFNEVRSKLHASNEADWKRRKEHSASLRREMIARANSATLPGATEAILGLLSGATLLLGGLSDDDVKEKGRRLREAGRMLSDKKHEMLYDDKQLVWERIQEVQREHDKWWTGYKRERTRRWEEQNRQFEEKQAECRRGTLERIEKAKNNKASNTDRLEKALKAVVRVRTNIAENEVKRASAQSDKWRDLFGQWVREGEVQARDVEKQVDRLRGWIEEDRQRIALLKAKL